MSDWHSFDVCVSLDTQRVSHVRLAFVSFMSLDTQRVSHVRLAFVSFMSLDTQRVSHVEIPCPHFLVAFLSKLLTEFLNEP